MSQVSPEDLSFISLYLFFLKSLVNKELFSDCVSSCSPVEQICNLGLS